MNTYETDIIAWASEQARLLREGRFEQLDIAHLAEEIEDVRRSEQRELPSRLAVLLAHLLKWGYQPERARQQLAAHDTRPTPCHPVASEAHAQSESHAARRRLVGRDLGGCHQRAQSRNRLDCFPETCPWPQADIFDPRWLPAPSTPRT